MSDLHDLVLVEAVLAKVSSPTKRQALQTLCDALCEAAGIDARGVFESVLMREKLAGTGAGDGVAIPHARVPRLKAPIGGFARFDPAHDFEAMDGRPADLVFLLLAPEERGADHLKALARVSRFLRRADMREKLRAARSVEALRALFVTSSPRNDAAA